MAAGVVKAESGDRERTCRPIYIWNEAGLTEEELRRPDTVATLSGTRPCGRLFDANGVEHERVLWLNAETGEIAVPIMRGGLMVTDGNTLATQRRHVAMPFRIEWTEGREPKADGPWAGLLANSIQR